MTIRKVEKRFIDVRNPDHRIKNCEIRKYSLDDPRGQIESLDEVAESIERYLKESGTHPYQPNDYDLESALTIVKSLIENLERKAKEIEPDWKRW